MRKDPKKKAVEALIQIVERLREVDPDMELGKLIILLHIINRPSVGLSRLEYLSKLGNSAVSRNVADLSPLSYRTDANKEKIAGLGFIVTAVDPFDARAVIAAPTKKGRDFHEEFTKILSEAMGGEPPMP